MNNKKLKAHKSIIGKKNLSKKISVLLVIAFVMSLFTYSIPVLANADTEDLKPANLQSMTQRDSGGNKIVTDDSGKKIFMSGKLSSPSKQSPEEIVSDFAKADEDVIKTNTLRGGEPSNNFKIVKKYDNVYGDTVLEVNQTYKDIPVYNTTKYYHVDKDGIVNLVSGSFAFDMSTANGLKEAHSLYNGTKRMEITRFGASTMLQPQANTILLPNTAENTWMYSGQGLQTVHRCGSGPSQGPERKNGDSNSSIDIRNNCPGITHKYKK